MNPRIFLLLILFFIPASNIFTEDDKSKKFEEYKKEIKEKFKDSDIDSLIEGAEKLEEYYKLKSASIFREIALEKLTEHKKQIEESLKKINEFLKTSSGNDSDNPKDENEIKDTGSDKIEPEKIDSNLERFLKYALQLLTNELSLLKIKYDRCKHWLDDDNKGNESTILYVNIEKSLIANRENDFAKRIDEIEKYDVALKFDKADQKRILLKNALTRLNTFIDGKIKAYESTLKSIKRRKKLKDTTVQKKAEMRIEYYKWIKPYIDKKIEILKEIVESEMNIKKLEDKTFFNEHFSEFSSKIEYPKFLTISESESGKLIKILKAHIDFLKKDKKNPE